jgi:hypothetical protein
VLGEAGIGKSRLLSDFVAWRSGAVTAQARPGDAAVLARLLRAVFDAHPVDMPLERRQVLALVLPELGAPTALSGQAQRLLLLRTVEACIADAQRGGLQALVLDDVHFADDASAEFVQSPVSSDLLAPLRWALAQRGAEGSAAVRALRSALDEAQRADTVSLQPLNLEQTALLIDSLGIAELDARQLAPALLRHTGDNPMFALETLKDLVLSPATPSAAGVPQLPAAQPHQPRVARRRRPPALTVMRWRAARPRRAQSFAETSGVADGIPAVLVFTRRRCHPCPWARRNRGPLLE